MNKEYLPHQKIEMLKPAKVSREFGIPIETLSYLREESLQSGKLRGPVFLKMRILFYIADNGCLIISSKILLVLQIRKLGN